METEKGTVWTQEARERILEKMDRVSRKSAHKIPYTTVNGVHDNKLDPDRSWTPDNGRSWWTNGFFAGILWQLYHATGEERYRETARFSETALDSCFSDYYGLHHDVGFMWLPTAVADYRLTGNEESRKRGLHAANLLAGRYNPAGAFIRAWNDFGDGRDTSGWAIIDCLMNLPLLYWADGEVGDYRYGHIALNHAETAARYFLRKDGSVRHIITFNPKTGIYQGSLGGQGYAHGSAWSRGQAWAIYGFAVSSRCTGKKVFAQKAEQAADYFLAHLLPNGLAPVDFCQPAEENYEDSSAAAIAACGLLELAALLKKKKEEKSREYKYRAGLLLRNLYENRCNFQTDEDCILEGCSVSYAEAGKPDHLIYGDYYLIEGIFRLNGEYVPIW